MGTHLNSDTKCDIDNLGYTLTESPILGTVYLISFHCPITKFIQKPARLILEITK